MLIGLAYEYRVRVRVRVKVSRNYFCNPYANSEIFRVKVYISGISHPILTFKGALEREFFDLSIEPKMRQIS